MAKRPMSEAEAEAFRARMQGNVTPPSVVTARGPGAPTSVDKRWGKTVIPRQEGDLAPHYPGPDDMSPAEEAQARHRESIYARRRERGLPGPKIHKSKSRSC